MVEAAPRSAEPFFAKPASSAVLWGMRRLLAQPQAIESTESATVPCGPILTGGRQRIDRLSDECAAGIAFGGTAIFRTRSIAKRHERGERSYRPHQRPRGPDQS